MGREKIVFRNLMATIAMQSEISRSHDGEEDDDGGSMSEMLVNFYETRQHDIPEDSHLQLCSFSWEKLKSCRHYGGHNCKYVILSDIHLYTIKFAIHH
jgi:hypothetical protein